MMDEMIKTSIPTNPFDRFLSSYEEDATFIDHNTEIHSILVYIGLITVILFVLLLIFSFISKCIKIFHDETIATTKMKQHRMEYRRYGSNSVSSRQTSFSAVSSSSLVINYQTSKISSKPTLTSTLRMLQYKEQHLSPIVNV